MKDGWRRRKSGRADDVLRIQVRERINNIIICPYKKPLVDISADLNCPFE